MPIISLVDLLNGFISGLLAWRLARRSYVNDPTTKGARYFIWFFACFGVMWILYGLEGIISTEPTMIARTNMVADLMVYVSAAIAMQIVFYAMNKPEFGLLAVAVYLTLGFTYLILRLNDPGTYEQVDLGFYVYWVPTFSPLLRILTGIAATSASFIFTVTFFILGIRNHKNWVVLQRSLYFALGMAGIVVASVIFFLTHPNFFSATVAAAFSVSGLGLLYHGVLLHPTQTPEQPRH